MDSVVFNGTQILNNGLSVFEVYPIDISQNPSSFNNLDINDPITLNIIPLKPGFALSQYNITLSPQNALSNIVIDDNNNTLTGNIQVNGSVYIGLDLPNNINGETSFLATINNYRTFSFNVDIPVVRPVLMEGTKVYINPFETKLIEELEEGEHILVDKDNMVTAPIVKIYRELISENDGVYNMYDLSENMLGFDHSGVVLSSTAIISLGRNKYTQIESTNPDFSKYANNQYTFPNGPKYVYHIKTSSKNRLIYTEAGVAVRTYSSIENVSYDSIIKRHVIRNKLIDYFS
jgi:hypothetical protein